MTLFLRAGPLRAGLFILCLCASLTAGAAVGSGDEDASAVNKPLPAIPAPATDAEIDESQFSTDTAPPALDLDYRQPAPDPAAP